MFEMTRGEFLSTPPWPYNPSKDQRSTHGFYLTPAEWSELIEGVSKAVRAAYNLDLDLAGKLVDCEVAMKKAGEKSSKTCRPAPLG